MNDLNQKEILQNVVEQEPQDPDTEEIQEIGSSLPQAEAEIPDPEPELEFEPEDEPEIKAEPQTGAEDLQAEVQSLRERLRELTDQLSQRQAAMERMSAECAEFALLYPKTDLSSLPPEVWDSVRAGIPLSAAYAYEQAKQRHAEAIAEQVNQRNREAYVGGVGGAADSFLSPDQVRRMSADQVRDNYSKILDSMKLWS